jgi:hypothetical protein
MANHTHCTVSKGLPFQVSGLMPYRPWAPPKTSVHSETSFSITTPNASVTIARYGPFTRSDGSAISTPHTPATTADSGSASQGLNPVCALSSAAVYAPAAKRPAWPSDFWPA